MVKKLPGVEKMFENFFKKKLIQDKKWNKKIGGRNCFITSGAFGDTVQCSVLTLKLYIKFNVNTYC